MAQADLPANPRLTNPMFQWIDSRYSRKTQKIVGGILTGFSVATLVLLLGYGSVFINVIPGIVLSYTDYQFSPNSSPIYGGEVTLMVMGIITLLEFLRRSKITRTLHSISLRGFLDTVGLIAEAIEFISIFIAILLPESLPQEYVNHITGIITSMIDSVNNGSVQGLTNLVVSIGTVATIAFFAYILTILPEMLLTNGLFFMGAIGAPIHSLNRGGIRKQIMGIYRDFPSYVANVLVDIYDLGMCSRDEQEFRLNQLRRFCRPTKRGHGPVAEANVARVISFIEDNIIAPQYTRPDESQMIAFINWLSSTKSKGMSE